MYAQGRGIVGLISQSGSTRIADLNKNAKCCCHYLGDGVRNFVHLLSEQDKIVAGTKSQLVSLRKPRISEALTCACPVDSERTS